MRVTVWDYCEDSGFMSITHLVFMLALHICNTTTFHLWKIFPIIICNSISHHSPSFKWSVYNQSFCKISKVSCPQRGRLPNNWGFSKTVEVRQTTVSLYTYMELFYCFTVHSILIILELSYLCKTYSVALKQCPCKIDPRYPMTLCDSVETPLAVLVSISRQ